MEKKTQTFEDLYIWQNAKNIYHQMSVLSQERKQYFLKDQLLRATLSISNNIAEGYERQTHKELIRFLYIAKGSCAEVRSMLHIIVDEDMITQKEYDVLFAETQKLSVMIQKFINTL